MIQKYLMFDLILNLTGDIQWYIDQWSKNELNGSTNKSRLSSLLSQVKSILYNRNYVISTVEEEDDSYYVSIKPINSTIVEFLFISICGQNEIGNPDSMYSIVVKYIRRDVEIKCLAYFEDDKVSSIHYFYKSSISKEAFKYRKGKRISG